MQIMVSFLLVAVMVAVGLPHAGAIICYTCVGYYPGEDSDLYNNNPNCPQEDFHHLAVATKEFFGQYCYTQVEHHDTDGMEFTQRGGLNSLMTRDLQNVTYRGYYCTSDKCNDRPVSAAPLSRSLCLPLLLLSLLAALPRCLA